MVEEGRRERRGRERQRKKGWRKGMENKTGLVERKEELSGLSSIPRQNLMWKRSFSQCNYVKDLKMR